MQTLSCCIISVIFFTLAFCKDAIYERQKENTWFKDGINLIKNNLEVEIFDKKAHGAILFLGDGMGVTTVTAGRILDGQLKGGTGEENVLSFETYKHVGLSKTYNTDQTVPDSAGTATAFMTGVKARAGVISVNEKTEFKNCTSSKNNHVMSIIMMAEQQGLSTGVVTTARLSHATPATAYAHSASRYWESDAEGDCKDIASQLIDFPYGNGLEVALGGGRKHFLPNTTKDPEEKDSQGKSKFGLRVDGRDLTKEWQAKTTKNEKYEYIWNEQQFKNLDPNKVDHVLGLFEYSHMNYAYNRKNDTAGEPSIAEMTEFAIKVLQRNPKGYVLLVEGGRIDHAHHDNKAFHALHDTVAFNKAIDKANKITKTDESLIIVTADHSHVFTVGGYQDRGTDILGYTNRNENIARDGKKYTTLGYYNGPGAMINKPRKVPTDKELKTPDYMWSSTLIPLEIDTHGGEDVGVYARGCQAHMIRGVFEENYIFHVMDYALCLSDTKRSICKTRGLVKENTGSIGVRLTSYISIVIISTVINIFIVHT